MKNFVFIVSLFLVSNLVFAQPDSVKVGENTYVLNVGHRYGKIFYLGKTEHGTRDIDQFLAFRDSSTCILQVKNGVLFCAIISQEKGLVNELTGKKELKPYLKMINESLVGIPYQKKKRRN